MDERRWAVKIVSAVQAMPYTWPAPPDAASCRRNGAGSCASKHALLAEELHAIGVESAPLFALGPLVPAALAEDPEIAPGVGLQEVHELLTMQTPWAGPLRVDVTWDPPLIARGLPGTLDWDGAGDMLTAVARAHRTGLRRAKPCVRRRRRCAGGSTGRASAKSGTVSWRRWRAVSRSGGGTRAPRPDGLAPAEDRAEDHPRSEGGEGGRTNALQHLAKCVRRPVWGGPTAALRPVRYDE